MVVKNWMDDACKYDYPPTNSSQSETPPDLPNNPYQPQKKLLGCPTCIVSILYTPSISSNVIDFTCPWCRIMGSFFDFSLHQVLLELSITCCIFSAHSVSPFDWKYTLAHCLISGVHYKVRKLREWWVFFSFDFL